MDNYNSSVSVYGLVVSVVSSGMISTGYDLLFTEKKIKEIFFRTLGASMLIGGTYLFVPSVFRNLWFR